MRRHKIVTCIVLILSVFSFVLAAPVAVREVREACTDAVDGGDHVRIGSGKRADSQGEEDPMGQRLAQAQQEPSSSDPSQHQGSSSAPKYASGTHPNPSFSSEGAANSIQPVISTDSQPASSSKAKSVSWAPWRKLLLPSGDKITLQLPPETKELPLPPGRAGYLAKTAGQMSRPLEPGRASFSSYFENVPLPPGRAGYLAKTPGQISKPLEVGDAPLSSYFEDLPPPPGREGYLAKTVAQESPSEGFISDSMKVLGKLKFRPRSRRVSGTVSGTVDAAQRELQGTP